MAKVTGIVTLDGEPLEGAKVIFQPKKGQPAAGITDGKGRYSLTTLENHDGAVPGQYRVIISTEAPSEPKKEGNPQVTL
ncbi:MAG: carboxypeptidase-like regulatory domain-containing protein, partial [Planctomycetes bacterium]|nr:carboxypeptidase-like regulatory domain-containing protein [Planctomycetota bacterium]